MSADILVELHEDDQADIAKRVDDETLADILDEMEPDDAADVIGDLPEDRQQRVLADMEEGDDVRPLFIHPDESAGGRMTNAFLALRPEMTRREAINALREWGPDNETAYYLFVVDTGSASLVGVVSLRHLITARPTMLHRRVDEPRCCVGAGWDRSGRVRPAVRKQYGFMALPVVDAEHRLVGIITVDDIVDVIEEEATEDTFRMGGVPRRGARLQPISVSYEEARCRGYMSISARHFWRHGCTACSTGTVDARHFWRPCRALWRDREAMRPPNASPFWCVAWPLGEVELKDAWRMIVKEVWIGLLQGLALALIVGAGVAVWQSNPDSALWWARR